MMEKESDKSEVRFGAGYIRVSTNMQEELSPDAQKRLISEYAHQNSIIIPDELFFMEKGISGRKADKRPEFQRMIATAKSTDHPIDVILVWKFSRFARNQEESIVYKSLLKKQCNIDVISVSEPIIDGPFGSLIERIIEWMDEYYSTRLSGEVFRGMSEKAIQGGYQARPPLGYKIIEKGKPPVIVPEEAEIIRLIFNKYVNEGMSIFQITKFLNSIGLKTSHGKAFEKRSLEYILQNPTYIGKIRWNRTENSTNRIKDSDEWIIKEGKHEAILNQDIFDKAQQRFNSEYHPKNARPSDTSKHWLSGLIKCSACGRTLSSSKQSRKEWVYYSFQCYGYMKGKCTISHSISAKKAETSIKEIILRDLNDNSFKFERIRSINTSDAAIKSLETQLARITQKEIRIKEAYRDGIDTLEEYKENKQLIQKEHDDLIYQINKLKAPSLMKSDADYQNAMRKNLQNVYDVITSDNFTVQQKNETLKRIITKIVYNKSEDSFQLYYHYNGNDAAL